MNKIYNKEKNQEELKQGLIKMHCLIIVHLDLKQAKISFSHQFKKWIFLDFCFTKFIKEKFFEKTLTYFIGIYDFASSDMKKAYHIISYHIISYHILSYHILSYLILSYHIISYHIISYLIISYHIISYLIISYLIIYYLILCYIQYN